jgi:hypothetical protein
MLDKTQAFTAKSCFELFQYLIFVAKLAGHARRLKLSNGRVRNMRREVTVPFK